MRRATQDAASIDEWCEIMKKGNNGGYANAWLLGDVNTSEIARLELGLKHVGFERTKDGYFVGSNIAEDSKILRLETNATRPTSATPHRPPGAMEAAHEGERGQDRRSSTPRRSRATTSTPTSGEDRPGGRSLCAHWRRGPRPEMQRCPFTPSGRSTPRWWTPRWPSR